MQTRTVLLLICFVCLAVVTTYLPHAEYQYPLHVDEWVHFQFAQHLSNNAPLYFGGGFESLEAGFHYLLATLNVLGVPYLIQFTFFSSLFTIFLCISMFILVRRLYGEDAAVFSVLFIALLQSTVEILGPAFFVPLTVGLVLLPIALFLVFVHSRALIIIVVGIFIIHPPSALAIVLLITIEQVIRRKNLMQFCIDMVLAGLIAVPFYMHIFLREGISSVEKLNFVSFSQVVSVPVYIGFVMLFICIIGFYQLFEKRQYTYPVFVMCLLVIIVLFYYVEIEFFIPYRRVLMYLFIVFSVLFGYGCKEIISLGKTKTLQGVILIILISIVLLFSLPQKLDDRDTMYHIVSDSQYESFGYIAKNTPHNARVLADPWVSNALTPLAQREVYSRIVQGPNHVVEIKNQKVQAFFRDGCTDTNFLVENNISVVYGDCLNDALVQVHEKVYLVPLGPDN